MRKINTLLTKDFVAPRLVGRLGNMMFQIAHAYVMSLEHDRQLVVPKLDSCSDQFKDTIFRKIDFYIDSTRDVELTKGTFTYCDIIPNNDKPTYIEGYFQSEKFFKNYSQKVKDLFSPTQQFLNKVESEYPQFKSSTVAAVNVRRGDYLTFPNRHPVVTKEFLDHAVTLLPPHDHLLIMSDDLQWCKDNLNYENSFFVEWKDEMGLWLLSLCDHYVISNSTFSWWGAYLSNTPDKTVIVPSTWFGPDMERENIVSDDIYCENWIQVPTKWNNGFIDLIK